MRAVDGYQRADRAGAPRSLDGARGDRRRPARRHRGPQVRRHPSRSISKWGRTSNSPGTTMRPFHTSGRRGGFDDLRFEGPRLPARKLSGGLKRRSDDRFASCFDLDRVPVGARVEIDGHLPDDLAGSLDHDFGREQCERIFLSMIGNADGPVTRRSLSITWRVTFVDRHGHDHSSPRGRRSAWTVTVAGFRIPKAVMIDSGLGPDVQMVSAASMVGVRSSADIAAPARRPPRAGGHAGV